MFLENITPYSFMMHHISVFEEILKRTGGRLPAYKIGNRYYISKTDFVDLDFGIQFEDGIIMPIDMVRTIDRLLSILKNEIVLKSYPIFTQYHKNYYKVVVRRQISDKIYVVTSSSRLSKWIAKKSFHNISTIFT
jgi:hypothetical protein